MHFLAIATFLYAYLFAFVGMSYDYKTFRSLVSDEFEEIKAIANPQISLGGGHANCLAFGHKWIEPTPSQPQGPFYPIKFPSDVDMDLTKVGDGPSAIGTVVYVQGQVMDREGHALKDAVIEIWQACASGKYDHPLDSNPSEADPNFQYYGQFLVDKNGQYIFKTIVPGPYPASKTWWRPPHIHFKINRDGFKETITQLYFDGNSFTEPVTRIGGRDIGAQEINQYNSEDLILNRLSLYDQKKLIVRFQEIQNIKLGVFNIYLDNL